jgi:hypothetical protein
VRIPDGILGRPGRRIGIEVELHRKAAHRYDGILADLDPELSEVWWFCRLSDLPWLRDTLAAVPRGIEQQVYPLSGDLRGVLG